LPNAIEKMRKGATNSVIMRIIDARLCNIMRRKRQ
jgi:hypothetical protein